MKTRRVFFALWPPVQVRQAVAEIMSQLGHDKKARMVSPDKWHITLCFVGTVSEESMACMHNAAQAVNAAAFDITLDYLGYFPRARIGWMGCKHPPAALMQLHDKLGTAIEDCGYQAEKRQYQPHITLKKKAASRVLTPPVFSIRWPVSEFVLVESKSDNHGVNYQLIEKYAFA